LGRAFRCGFLLAGKELGEAFGVGLDLPRGSARAMGFVGVKGSPMNGLTPGVGRDPEAIFVEQAGALHDFEEYFRLLIEAVPVVTLGPGGGGFVDFQGLPVKPNRVAEQVSPEVGMANTKIVELAAVFFEEGEREVERGFDCVLNLCCLFSH
jgi:hypothetical protein